jgi:signal transduction histidine kinase
VAQLPENERARLERDLHDGVLQRVFALQLGLAHAREQAPPPLAAVLEGLERQARLIGGELRALAHGIYPGTLLDRGLRAALDEATLGAAGRVTVHGDVGRLPEPVERAAYFCVLEAIQNMLRHAGAWATARVTLRADDGVLRFEVVDNGVGFDGAAAPEGLGLRSMRERVAAVGGQLVLESAPGNGVAVRGAIPLPEEET